MEVGGESLLTCWCRKAKGLVERLVMPVTFHVEQYFSWRRIYTSAGCSDGTYNACLTQKTEAMQSPLGGSGLGGPGSGASRFLAQVPILLCQVTLFLYISALLSQSEAV